MLRSAVTRSIALRRAAASPALAQASANKALANVGSAGVRAATTYASILDKVLGVDVREKVKYIPREEVDPIYKKPQKLPAPHGVRVFIRRWTVLKSPFVHKSAMEVFERRTYKRILIIRDADPEVVKKWLEYINKNIPAGLGMKYWLTEYEPLNVGEQLQKSLETRDPRKIDANDLALSKYADTVIQRGRTRLWATYKDLPVYGRADVEKLALDVANQLRVNPKANIEEVTRSVVMGTRPPKEKKTGSKAKSSAAPVETASAGTTTTTKTDQ
ncbi:mitochondrial 37S ribosomal protein rsm10 [Dipsacomyces acuminosporus]|nr:mitochondrial 37S ribosomal protein rsm10 [Dipsacomyces acuminosporus]